MRSRVVPLAQGLWRDGGWHREATVRALTGLDEARLAELAPSACAAERVTALLAAAVLRIGGVAPIRDGDARALTVGDRERLLLALQGLTFGPRLEAVARCPAEGCATLMELELDIDDLLAAGAPAVEQGASALAADPSGNGRAEH